MHVNDGIGGGVLTAPDRRAAESTPAGIFMADGPDFEAAGEVGETQITDIVPALLVANGLAVPTDLTAGQRDIIPVL